MIEGIKLYKEFRKELDKVGHIKRAWFTTFNLDINFFEQWILPLITKVDFSQAKTLRDYEEMNDLLTDTKDKAGIEVRVFYDYRAIKNQSETKRTSIFLHPINSEKFTIQGNRNYFKGGVFHPKVGLIETESGEHFILVLSANLTLSGWARNRECFFFSKIQGVTNAKNIGLFFEEIISELDFSKNSTLIEKLNSRRKLWGADQDWAFISSKTHSFEEELQKRAENSIEKSLTVWSPYWSLELKHLLENILKTGFNKIRLLPSKNDGKIAITQKIFDECSNIEGVTFVEEKQVKELDSLPFIHAKVWMADNFIGIGSWNMTRPGTNIQKSSKRTEDTKNNMEAGIFIKINKSEYSELINSAGFKKLSGHGFKTEEEIEKERNDLLETFSFPVTITADWIKGTYALTYPKYSSIQEEYLNAVVCLPDGIKVKLRRFNLPVRFITYESSLVNNRFFSIKLKEKEIYHGFINETGLEHRPINEFNTEVDLLMSWINGVPENRPDLIKKRIPKEDDEYKGDGKDPDDNGNPDDIVQTEFFKNHPWFNNLLGFASIRAKITEASSLGRLEDRKNELIRIGRLIPGSVAELRSKMIKRRDQYNSIDEAKKPSPVFLWFMIEETNHCIEVFNNQIKKQKENAEKIKKIDNINISGFFNKMHSNYSKEQIDRYLNLARTTIKNGK